MKNKILFFFLPLLVIIGMVVNSCKKESQNTIIESLFTNGRWQLASVIVYNDLGANTISTDTLNTNCDSTQVFTFKSNNTCTYTNFDCIPQVATGTWSLSSNQLTLMSNITCKDTLPGAIPSTGKPFANAQILNLGQYSMILQTGDINVYYTATTKRTLVQYGFIRTSAPVGN